ncbi:hypothetical protein KFK09_009562 [Dendrobium nobile]|uniref:Uncharacterized protein n=1 Tax=Dendrobium nobile TaxID=94219 RepID=A0A8T3BHH6_DENNO|nr:hypothetical protein KFK09_009562 [Dendrobium nobile]
MEPSTAALSHDALWLIPPHSIEAPIATLLLPRTRPRPLPPYPASKLHPTSYFLRFTQREIGRTPLQSQAPLHPNRPTPKAKPGPPPNSSQAPVF